jgi:dTDP-4-amino-4,6-dideoxygalactose transaminase
LTTFDTGETDRSHEAEDAVFGAVPFADPGITADDIAAVVDVLRSGWITTGPECDALERELAEYLECPHVVSVSSGTAALEIALASLALPEGARVAVPTWTFVASAFAAVHNGATPVLVDVEPGTLNMSPTSLEAALGTGLSAVVAVHFGGVPVDRAVHDLCAAAGVPVVEDAAHALGASDHRGRLRGQGSVAACFSFYATKNMTSAEGGALATDDRAVAEFARTYRLHGLSSASWGRHRNGANGRYACTMAGIKANLPDLLAALARSQLARFEKLQAQRRTLVERYSAVLAAVDGVETVPASIVAGAADHLQVVLVPEGVERDRVVAAMAAAGVATSVHFQPLHRFEWFARHAETAPGGVPVAERLADRALSLPLHPGLEIDDVDRACHALAGALSS